MTDRRRKASLTDRRRGLGDFAGLWQVDRRIDDRLGPAMRFVGTALLTGDDPVLIYHEQGQLSAGQGPALAASRRYSWRAEGADIAVYFDDGRPFHCFDPVSTCATALHDCPPDRYEVRYDFSGWPDWSSRWQVRGPRKDYVMDTRFWRAE